MAIASVTVAYNKFERNEKAKKTIIVAKTALDNFYANQKRYPCPADPTLAPTDPNFGMENCSLTAVPGARAVAPANNVLVGGFPLFAMAMEAESATRKPIALSEFIDAGIGQEKPFMDPWHHQLTYAVTTQLVGDASGNPRPDRMDRERGNIAVVDENGDNTGGTNGNADYVIVAHGKNGLGARNANNTLTMACDSTYTLESENCDGDSRFIQGISNINEGNRPAYLDDYVTYTRVVDTSIWAKRVNADGTPDENTIYNTNMNGNIGIKTTNPISSSVKLDVNGTIEASDIVSADSICDSTGANCFAPESLYNIQCPAGQVLDKINISGSNFSPRCVNMAVPPTSSTGCAMTCPGYQVVRGFNSNGCPVCSDPVP